MMKSRKLNPNPPKRGAIGLNQWNLLLRKAVVRAQAANDPRVTALQQALGTGDAEKVLRRMSIICDADLAREFPVQST